MDLGKITNSKIQSPFYYSEFDYLTLKLLVQKYVGNQNGNF